MKHLQLILVSVFAFCSFSVEGKLVRYTFKVNYFSGSPDGVWKGHILGINGKFPGPLIEAETGDIVQVKIVNNIQDRQNVTMHWHGLHMKGEPFEDGPSQITQCPIRHGSHQVYRFKVRLPGTYWYHSHVDSQYTEGLWGAIVVRARSEVYGNQYKKELLITLNDWYHTSGHQNEEWLLGPEGNGAPPFPSAALMNGVGRYPCQYATAQGYFCNPDQQKRPVFYVQPGKTYRLRLVNAAGWTQFNFTVDGHTLETIEVDGVDTRWNPRTNGEGVYISAGQRNSFLLRTRPGVAPGSDFLIRASVRDDTMFRASENINPYQDALFLEVTGVLRYMNEETTNNPNPESPLILPVKEKFDHNEVYSPNKPWNNLKFVEEMQMIPYDGRPAPSRFDLNVVLNITFRNYDDGIRRGSFNNRPFQLTDGEPMLSKFVKGQHFPQENYPVKVGWGEVVQVVVNNPDRGAHPIHLHGHHFWVMGIGKAGSGPYDSTIHQLRHNGVLRDTVIVKENSWLVLRFKADNVGVWTLHCHIDWHMLTGMMMTFVEAPELAHQIRISPEAKRVCREQGVII